MNEFWFWFWRPFAEFLGTAAFVIAFIVGVVVLFFAACFIYMAYIYIEQHLILWGWKKKSLQARARRKA